MFKDKSIFVLLLTYNLCKLSESRATFLKTLENIFNCITALLLCSFDVITQWCIFIYY